METPFKNIKIYDELYGRNAKGAVLVWRIRVVDTGISSIIMSESGLFGGKMKPTHTEVTRGKNVGKANATTTYEQANNMAQAKWQKKRQRGYKSLEDLGAVGSPNLNTKKFLEKNLPHDKTDNNDVLKPMKAQKFYKELKSGTALTLKKWPCMGQPKINGVRCFAVIEEGICELKSKEGTSYRLDAITDEIENWCQELNIRNIIIDGELYIKDYILADITSAVRKYNMNTILIKFHMFDLAIPDHTQFERIKMLHQMWAKRKLPIDRLVFVETKGIKNEKDAIEYGKLCISKGYEGAIFRDPRAYYGFGKRPATMVKWKTTVSAEFKIIDVIESETDRGKGIFVCKNDLNHVTFKVTPAGYSHNARKYFLLMKSEIIGKMLTVTFYERTAKPKELPFHVTETVIRDYESEESFLDKIDDFEKISEITRKNTQSGRTPTGFKSHVITIKLDNKPDTIDGKNPLIKFNTKNT